MIRSSVAERWLPERGYAVLLLQRPGHGDTRWALSRAPGPLQLRPVLAAIVASGGTDMASPVVEIAVYEHLAPGKGSHAGFRALELVSAAGTANVKLPTSAEIASLPCSVRRRICETTSTNGARKE